MKVLIILAHKSSPRGGTKGQKFIAHIKAAFAACTHFQEKLELIIRSQSRLAEFIPPPAGESDGLDTPRPWMPP